MRLIHKPKLIRLKHHFDPGRVQLVSSEVGQGGDEGHAANPEMGSGHKEAGIRASLNLFVTNNPPSSILHHYPQYWCSSGLYTNDWVPTHGSNTLTKFADETPVGADQQWWRTIIQRGGPSAGDLVQWQP